MTWLLCVPLVVAAALGPLAPRLAPRTLPTAGLWALTLGAAAVAAGTCWSVVLLVATLLDEETRVPPHIDLAVPDWVGAVGAVLLALGLVRLVRTSLHRYRLHRALRAACEAYPPGELVVLDDPVPRAFALPGRPARIVASRGMLDVLPPQERRVLLAHERAHLEGRHHWHLALAGAATSINPLLRPAELAVRYLCERWADERAAERVGDRELTATALARAALAGASAAGPGPGFANLGVTARVNALTGAPPRRWVAWCLAVGMLVAAVAIAEITATWDLIGLLGTIRL